MTLRLVLVSLVAGLGISLPGWPVLEGWVASSQKWMNARLAEWDDRRSDEQDYVVIHDLLKVEMERARMARLTRRLATYQDMPVAAVPTAAASVGLTGPHPISLEQSAFAIRSAVALIPLPVGVDAIDRAPGGQAEVVAATRVEPSRPERASFEPLVVGDRLYVGTAFELNHRNEGIGILPRVVARPAAAPAVQAADLLALVGDRFGSTAVRAARDLGRDLRAVAARELVAREDAARERAAQRIAAAELAALEAADRERGIRERAAREAAAAELAAREAAAIAFEAMENGEGLYFADAPEAPVATVPEVVAALPSFEAMEAGESLYFADVPVAEVSGPVADVPAADPTAAGAVVAVDVLPDDPFAPAEPAAVDASRPTQQAGVARPGEEVQETSEPEVVAIRTVRNSEVRRPEVSRAVRLTREALYAWANVLAEPSLVAAGRTATINR